MDDQAAELRQLVRREATPSTGPPVRPKLVVVTGGRQGVGATTIAVNLAVVLSRRGARGVLVDADAGRGGAAALCDIQEPPLTPAMLTDSRRLGEALQPGPGGLLVLPGTWARGEVSEDSALAQERLIGQLRNLNTVADFIVVDAGAGLGRLARRFWQVADPVMPVATADLGVVMDTYASIKVLSGGNDSLTIYPVVNRAKSPAEVVEVHTRLARACLRFLGIRLSGAGSLLDDPRISLSSAEPFVLSSPDDRAALQVHRLAETLAAKTHLASFDALGVQHTNGGIRPRRRA